MSSLCKELIAKGENDQTHGGGLLNKRIAWLIRRKQFYLSAILKKKIDKEKNLKFTPYIVRDCDILIDEDIRLCDIGIPLDGKIINTPGHTVDSISILFDDGACLAGDAAASMLKFAGTKNCVIFICDLDEYYKSGKKIMGEGAKTIFPAHGKPFSAERLKVNLGKNKTENLISY
jgi:glyoxylase-like metal-dependent hydrolase (beta-lactamase superfamily II)